MSFILLIAFLACLWGLLAPYKGLKRWHFGIGALASFILIAAMAPTQQKKAPVNSDRDVASASQVSPAEAAAFEKKNAPEIATLLKKAAKLPDYDLAGKRDTYQRLHELAPSNADFADKLTTYDMEIEAEKRYQTSPQEALTLGKVNWYKGGFDSIMMIRSVKVSNAADFPIKDFTLKCTHSAPSGTEIDSNERKVFEIIPAHGTKSIREFNMGFISPQAAATSCEITEAIAA